MGRPGTLIFALIVTVSLCGCGGSGPKGFYISEGSTKDSCLEFKSNGKVIIRDLSSPSTSVQETTFVVENNVVRIHDFKIFEREAAIEFSIVDDTLVSADGLKFKKDTSGKTYTPAELLAEANKRSGERHAQAEAKEHEKYLATLKAQEEQRKAQEEEDKGKAEQAQQIALQEQAKAERAKAIEQAKLNKEIAKGYAANHLPTFTNQIVTLTCNDGATYSNITLLTASLDGISYRYTDTIGGGLIPYSKLNTAAFDEFGIDTNIIAVAEDRSAMRAELDRQYRQMLTTEGAAKANAYRQDWSKRMNSYSAQQEFAKRYGVKPSRN